MSLASPKDFITNEELKRLCVHAKRAKDNALLRLKVTRWGRTKTLRQWYSHYLHMEDAKIDCFCPVCVGDASLVKG